MNSWTDFQVPKDSAWNISKRKQNVNRKGKERAIGCKIESNRRDNSNPLSTQSI